MFGANREITGKADEVIHIMSHDGCTKQRFSCRLHKLKLVTPLVRSDSNERRLQGATDRKSKENEIIKTELE